MSAEIIQLAEFRGRRQAGDEPQQHWSFRAVSPEQPPRFQFWTGASGKRYVHTVYSLFDCPTLEDANYILVRRSGPLDARDPGVRPAIEPLPDAEPRGDPPTCRRARSR